MPWDGMECDMSCGMVWSVTCAVGRYMYVM